MNNDETMIDYSDTPFDPVFLGTPTLFPSDERQYLAAWRLGMMAGTRGRNETRTPVEDEPCPSCTSTTRKSEAYRAGQQDSDDWHSSHVRPMDGSGMVETPDRANIHSYSSSDSQCNRLNQFPRMSRSQLYNTPLPNAGAPNDPTNRCFGGTGFGVWDDVFAGDYNRDKQGDESFRKRWYGNWRILGILHAQMGLLKDDPALQRLREVYNASEYQGDTQGNNYIEVVHASRATTILGGDSAFLSDLIKGYAESPSQALLHELDLLADEYRGRSVFIDEPEGNGMNVDDYESVGRWINALRHLLYGSGNTSGPCRITVYISTYTYKVVEHLVANFQDALRQGCIGIMPEQYYQNAFGSLSQRWSFWNNVAELYDFYGLSRRLIRPFISPVCDYCAQGADDAGHRGMECCTEEFLVFDVIKAMELGMAGPSIYMGNGMSQPFYDYFVFASWLAGCIGEGVSFAPPFNKRPRTYGELFSLLDTISIDPKVLSDFKATLKTHYPNFQESIYENPASCTRLCRTRTPIIDLSTGKVEYVHRKIGPCCNLPLCKDNSPRLCATDPFGNLEEPPCH